MNPAHVTISGKEFRPISCASLAWLWETNSPLVHGGTFRAVDFCVFAWLHCCDHTPQEVQDSINAGTYLEDALAWGIEAPPAVFSLYSAKRLKALEKDLSLLFADKKSGFVPFPCPLPCRAECTARGLTTLRHLCERGLQFLFPKCRKQVAPPCR